MSQPWNKGIIMYNKIDMKHCTNYRAKTLRSIPGKILTKILENRLREKQEENFRFEIYTDKVKRKAVWNSLTRRVIEVNILNNKIIIYRQLT